MATRKRKVAKAQESESNFDSNEIAKAAFIEHAHVNTVYVNKATGDFYLHAPHEKRASDFDVVNRDEVELDVETPAE